jgi:heme exporter protein D
MSDEKQLTEKESLDLIARMISRAKDSYNSTGISAMMWGIVVAVCALVQLAELHYGFRLPFNIYLLTFAAIIPQIFISIKEKKEQRAKSYDDAYMSYIWLAFGISIFLMIVISRAVVNIWGPVIGDFDKNILRNSTRQFYEYISSFYLLLYGIPTFITGAACRFKPMLWGGILCWLFCIVTVFTNYKIDLLLIAFAAIVAWFIPGVIMQKDYTKAKREMAQSDV